MKNCFARNPSTHVDRHQQTTGLRADQVIQFARAIGLEVSLATFGMLEDLLLKINSKVGRGGGGCEGVSLQSPSRSKAGSTVAESVASRSFYSLPTITESLTNYLLTDPLYRRPATSIKPPSRRGVAFSQTQVTEIAVSDSSRTLG